MQAIVLAAGMGKRLGELTAGVTKCMVEVNGITLIERMLRQLNSLGLSRIVIVVGYQASRLKEFVATLGSATPIEWVENPDYDKTNNIYSLYLASHWLCEEDTLLLESDLIFDDYALTALVEDPSPNLALVAKYDSWMDGTVVTLDNNEITKFIDKADFDFSATAEYYKTVNIYKFSQGFSLGQYVPLLEAYCRGERINEYYEQVLKVIVLLGSGDLKAKVLDKGNWYEIDDIQDLDIAETIFTRTDEEKYHRITTRYGGYWRYPRVLDFCYLVNPFYPPTRLIEELRASFATLLTEYPSGQRVNDFLAAKYFGVRPSSIVTGNGAAELIKVLLEQISGRLGVIVPTFDEYPNRKPLQIVAFTPANEQFAYNADDLIDFFADKAISALVLINPDNPSGNYLARPDLLKLLDWSAERQIKLILDESFVDFANPADTLLVDEILEGNPHLIVVKSISKSHGVPGLRLGVLASSDPAMIAAIRRGVSIWNINSFGEYYLQIAGKYQAHYAAGIDQFIQAREEFFARLSEVAFLEPIPSQANYFACRLTQDFSAQTLAQILLTKYNILIKDLSGKSGIDGQYIRVAVRSQQDNMQLVDALNDIASGR